jgi:single-strand DNA-binding protein
MAGVNKAIIVGNLGADPEIRVVQNGSEDLKIASISVATTEKYKDKSGSLVEKTEWHRIKLFRGLAEIAEKYLKKGGQVYVEGKLRTNKYTDNNNIEKYSTEIVAENLTLLGGRREDENSAQMMGTSPNQQKQSQESYSAPDSMIDDDLPF